MPKQKIIIPSILEKFGRRANNSFSFNQTNSFRGIGNTTHFIKKAVELQTGHKHKVENTNDKLQKFKFLMED